MADTPDEEEPAPPPQLPDPPPPAAPDPIPDAGAEPESAPAPPAPEPQPDPGTEPEPAPAPEDEPPPTPDSAGAGGGGGASPGTADQDAWLRQTLGLNPGDYGSPDANAATPAADPNAGGAGGDLAPSGQGENGGGEGEDGGGGAPGAPANPADQGAQGAGNTSGEEAEPSQSGWLDRAIGAVGDGLAAFGNLIEDGATLLLSKLTPDEPPPRVELGTAQTVRADKQMAKLPPEDQQQVQALLDGSTPDERTYLTKALASGHTPDEIAAFANEIKGKDAEWMEKNLHVVGAPDGSGIKQQWHDSCAPTTIQAVKAELDPLYALKLRKESKDLTQASDTKPEEMNPALAEEQRQMLTSQGGVAVPRAQQRGGQGILMKDELNKQISDTGLQYAVKQVDEKNVDQTLAEADKALESGLPVPMRLESGRNGHAVSIVGFDPGPPRRYAVHDPNDGKIVTVTDKQIKDGDFDIAGYSKVSHVYTPSEKPEPAP